ncbi:hypothetical protein [Lentzea sp. NPDC004782]|uniref:hypothetical protein n=1 Tax=Lentzea sp. NPDC004782 TaxID=3154458 RepID=UPI0033BE5632
MLGGGATGDLLAGTDLVLLGIKSWDPRTYRRAASVVWVSGPWFAEVEWPLR